MAYFGGKVKYQRKPTEPFSIGEGENTYFPPLKIKKSESPYSRNVSSRNYPALSACPGRVSSFTAITAANGIGQRNNEYPHVVDGLVWKRWNGSAWVTVTADAMTYSEKAKFLEFNTEAAKYTVLASESSNAYSYDGSTAASIADSPATRFYTVDDYRLYALDDNVLKCSAAGSVTDWTTANDADSIAITSMVGAGTAIATYMDTVICWSENTMHVLYGNDPYDFELGEAIEAGCISDRTVIEHNSKLYFLDFGKFKAYTGGIPYEVSQKVKTYLEGINLTYKGLCCAGKDGRYIYLSIPYGTATANNLTLEYDTETNNWYVRDEAYVDFVNIAGYLYGLTAAGTIYKMNSGTTNNGTAIAWSWISGVWSDGVLSQKKVIGEYWLSLDLPVASTLSIYYSTTIDGNDFVLLGTFTASATEQVTRIQVPTSIMYNIDWRRIEFVGTGPCTIFEIEENLRIKKR